jgi:NADH:ubiquinone oxidoreductase subunit C
LSWEHVPGYVSEKHAHGEQTVVVEPERLVEAALHLRDEEGFSFLSDISPTDYLGWGQKGVAGYIGTATGRDLNRPSSQGFQVLPELKPKRFSMSYHLLALRPGAPRLRLQVWVEDGEPVPSVVEVWPTADWHEREAWDLMGIRIEGHPNLARILMDDDWEGHPLRKDYPIGGEPVRFSGEE